jgi:hypothetical protein
LQDHAGLKALFDKVLVFRLAIEGDGAAAHPATPLPVNCVLYGKRPRGRKPGLTLLRFL